MEDTSDLGGSCFEVINTDTESLDDRLTNYTSDADGTRADDVRSLGESDHSYEDESDDDDTGLPHQSHHSAIPAIEDYTNNALGNPSVSAELRSPSIEFPEVSDNSGPLKGDIASKKLIREIEEEESAKIVTALGIAEAPKRLAATICQTMAQDCLLIGEVLRIFYAGSASAEWDILNKISSAICANSDGCQNTDGIYNICRMNQFLSTQEAQVEIFPLSPYSIKVERCKSAQTTEENETKLHEITTDKGKTYKSALGGNNATIAPEWELPHIAIFYCSQFDDESTVQSRDVAWEFMTNHGVPSLFIQDAQDFTRPLSGPWKDNIDARAVHLCLESRDQEKPISPLRLPIDLTSFLNIDARQMNRNLTCLTGLKEEKDSMSLTHILAHPQLWMQHGLKHLKTSVPAWKDVDPILLTKWFVVFVVPVLLAAIAPLFLGSSEPGSVSPAYRSSPNGFTAPITSSVIATSTATSTTTVVNVVTSVSTATSTTTVKVTQIQSAASSSAPLGLSDKPSSAQSEPDPKKKICTVELYSRNKILIQVPADHTAAKRLLLGVTLHRGNQPINVKVSFIDKGMLVELPRREARGVLELVVFKMKKSRVEVFEVDFGKPPAVVAFERGRDLLQNVVTKVAGIAEKADPAAAASEGIRMLHDQTASIMDRIFEAGRTAQAFSAHAAEEAVHRVKDTLYPQDFADFLKGAHEELARQMQSTADIVEDLDMGVLQAQISAKLMWLKMQGKLKEYEEYQSKGMAYLQSKVKEQSELRKVRKWEQKAKFGAAAAAKAKDSKASCSGRKSKCRADAKKRAAAKAERKAKDGFKWKNIIAL